MIGGHGPNDQALIVLADRYLGVGDKRLERCDQRGRYRAAKPIDLELGRLDRRQIGGDLVERLLDHGVVGRRGHDDQAAGVRVEREPGVGYQLLKRREQAIRRLRCGQLSLQRGLHTERGGLLGRIRIGINPQYGRIGAGTGRLELLDRRLDRRVLGRPGPCQQTARPSVQYELRVGEHLLQHDQHALGIRGRDRIADQLILLVVGDVPLEFLE